VFAKFVGIGVVGYFLIFISVFVGVRVRVRVKNDHLSLVMCSAVAVIFNIQLRIFVSLEPFSSALCSYFFSLRAPVFE